MIVSNLVKFKKSLREAGLIETALRTLHWFKIISVLHSFDFTLKELSIRDGVLILNSFDEIDAPKVSQINGLHISMREIKEEELENLTFDEGMFPLEIMREHYARGLRFFSVFHEGTIVALNGIHMRYAHLSYIKRSAVQLPQGVAYLNCAMTSPNYRDLGIGTVLRTFALCQLWREDYKWVIGAVFTENSAALRWNLTNDFKKWGRISYIRFQGHDFWIKRLTKVGRQSPNLLNNLVTMDHAFQKFPLMVKS
ncbi:MAG: hypothetical protein A3C35_08585 [Omnitrophica bacterium RIFCSPHIGHO2_02_FULL_46_11]|nr:MAG: hypothetical protein A3A81_06190 [Omnitrophica bacterium RIFCSPLOWO2_01_FULL_45_10b]OGW87986.1 MAG: hypothetical protein A3C35_08585 [Omnitrophica bacterium RIFCSPHIGHO2_02_FULL_46_11]